MIGMLEGLRAGTADARQAEELDMRRQQYAAEMAMRQRALAMQEAQHAQAMQEGGLRLRQMQGIEDATANMRGLFQKDEAQKKQLGEKGIVSFAPGDWTDTSERAYNTAGLGLALAKGDIQGARGLQRDNKVLEANDLAKQMAQDPSKRKMVYQFVDKSAIPATIIEGKKDKNGRMISPDRIKFDADGYEHPLNDADVLRMFQGIAYSQMGLSDEAEKAFEGVNKRLRDAVNEGNRRKIAASELNSKADDRLADNELRRENMGLIRDQRAAARAGRGREMPPEILKELSALEQQYIQAAPKDKPGIERQYQMVLSRAGAAVGKPMGLPNQRRDPELKVNQDGSVQRGPDLFVPNPKKPGEYMPAKGLGPSALDKALEAYNPGAAPAQPPAPPQPVGRPGMPDYGRYGSAGYDQYVQDQLLARFIRDRTSPMGLQMPMRPVDFSKYNSTGR